MADGLFDLVKAGQVKSEPGGHFPLVDAAQAHRALESRQTTGATVLVPSSGPGSTMNLDTATPPGPDGSLCGDPVGANLMMVGRLVASQRGGG